MEEPEPNPGVQPQVHTTTSGSVVKVCNRCGRALRGQVRYYDQSGYWCVPCSKAEKNAYRASHLPCDDCGTDVRRGQEGVYEDRRLCKVCYQKRMTQALRRQMRAEARREKTERNRKRLRKIVTWAIVAIEFIVGGALVIWIHPLAPDTASSDDQLLRASTRPDAPMSQMAEGLQKQVETSPTPR